MEPKSLNTAASSNTKRWQKLAKFYTSVGLLAGLVAACNTGVMHQTSTNAQQDPFAQTRVQPNFQFNVQRQAGNCPQTVGLWKGVPTIQLLLTRKRSHLLLPSWWFPRRNGWNTKHRYAVSILLVLVKLVLGCLAPTISSSVTLKCIFVWMSAGMMAIGKSCIRVCLQIVPISIGGRQSDIILDFV